MLPVLVVEDDADLCAALCETLYLAGYEALSAEDGPSALRILQSHRVGLVISDVQMQPFNGHELLRQIKAQHPYIPVMLMTAYGVIDQAVEAMRNGACTYITKPFSPDKLLQEIVCHMAPALPGNDLDFVTEEESMRALLGMAHRVAASNATLMVTGESGSGKEVVARYVHRHSPRAAGPFVAVNCAAIPDNLLESTLFGYEKGAFSGASQAHAGKFEQAQSGTLLLDEISEMPLGLQAKLLRVLQEREVERLGGRKPVTLDIRVIATSNRDLQAEVAKGNFREDLYYRLNVFPLHLPPLRERRKDIVPLARYFLRLHAPASARSRHFSSAAEARLTQYGWPGNIRELENVVQRAIILSPADRIEAEHLYLPQEATPVAPASVAAFNPGLDMKSVERLHIMETLAAANGSRRVAGKMLGISERTLRHKLQQYRQEDLAATQGVQPAPASSAASLAAHAKEL